MFMLLPGRLSLDVDGAAIPAADISAFHCALYDLADGAAWLWVASDTSRDGCSLGPTSKREENIGDGHGYCTNVARQQTK